MIKTRRMKNVYFLLLAIGVLASCATDDFGSQDGVNSFLWRASLETLSFMPLSSTDSKGGVIITQWQAQKPNERIKLNVVILTSDLRADGIQVSVFRQVRKQRGWVDASTSKKTALAIENLILTKARNLRLSYGR